MKTIYPWTRNEPRKLLAISKFSILELTFYSVTCLTFSPSKFAFSIKDQMKLYEFLLHIKNKKCVLPIKVIFSCIPPYIGGAANAFCWYLRTGLRYRDAVDDNLLSVWFWAVIQAWTVSFDVNDPSKGRLTSHEEVPAVRCSPCSYSHVHVPACDNFSTSEVPQIIIGRYLSL